MAPITRSMTRNMTVRKYYFPEDIWNIIKEYNGIIGWEKPIIDFLNKPSYADLDNILGEVDLLGRDNYMLYYLKCDFYKRRVYKSISLRRKLLIQMFFKTRPSKHTILELCKKYLDKVCSSNFRVGDNIIYYTGRATVIKVNRVSMNVKLDNGREIRISGSNYRTIDER